MNPTASTITALAAALRDGSTTPRALLDAALAHVDRTDKDLNAYLSVTRDLAMQQADAAAKTLEQSPATASPLCGIPMALKDVLCVDGIETTAASKILKGFRPPYTGTAVQRLFDAGAVCVGKTNCDEFAMGSSTENSAFGPVGNPWDVERVPGGSSGGSAATVAAGSVPYSLGSDTGGSIRQPAALTGIVGYKPTYGRVSRFGLIAFASSLDQIGPFTRTVEDCAHVYSAIAGHDPRDSTSDPRAVDDPMQSLRQGVAGMRLGIPREYLGEGTEPGVRAAVEAAFKVLEAQGATLREVSLPSTDVALSVYYVIAPAECSSNLARYDGVRFGQRVERPSLTDMYLQTRGAGFGAEVKRRVMLGTYALSSGYYDAYYRQAQKVRTLVGQEFELGLHRGGRDRLPDIAERRLSHGVTRRPALHVHVRRRDTARKPRRSAGHLRAVRLRRRPPGRTAGARATLCGTARVFRVAHAYEQATDWHTSRSPFATEAA